MRFEFAARLRLGVLDRIDWTRAPRRVRRQPAETDHERPRGRSVGWAHAIDSGLDLDRVDALRRFADATEEDEERQPGGEEAPHRLAEGDVHRLAMTSLVRSTAVRPLSFVMSPERTTRSLLALEAAVLAAARILRSISPISSM